MLLQLSLEDPFWSDFIGQSNSPLPMTGPQAQRIGHAKAPELVAPIDTKLPSSKVAATDLAYVCDILAEHFKAWENPELDLEALRGQSTGKGCAAEDSISKPAENHHSVGVEESA